MHSEKNTSQAHATEIGPAPVAAPTYAHIERDLAERGMVLAWLVSLGRELDAGSLLPEQLVHAKNPVFQLEREQQCATTLRGLAELYSSFLGQAPGYLANIEAISTGSRTEVLREVFNLNTVVAELELSTELTQEIVHGLSAVRRLIAPTDNSLTRQQIAQTTSTLTGEGVSPRFVNAFSEVSYQMCRNETPSRGSGLPSQSPTSPSTLAQMNFAAPLREEEALDPSAKKVKEHLALSRMDLVDSGLRNPMLNYRASRGHRGVELHQCDAQRLFKSLVIDRNRGSFSPVSEHTYGDQMPGEKRTNPLLPTECTPGVLQKRLTNTAREARLCIEEQGSNTLFLILGMVHWTGDGKSEVPYRAPLVMVPVTLERSAGKSGYSIQYSGEDIEQNPALAHKLRDEYGITLPDIANSEELDFDAYIANVRSALAGCEGLRLAENDVSLGFVSFTKQAMYRDLDAQNWPADRKPWDDKQIQSLFLGGYGATAGVVATPNGRIDTKLNHDAHFPVIECDSSQAGVLLDVHEHHDLVVKGPPGTGKSQTITNIIAQAIAGGKTVLFVSEKMAALDVVKRRLDAVGLGDLCLELHSHTAPKRGILQQIEATLQSARPTPFDRKGAITRIHQLAEQLNGYSDQLSSPIGASSSTPFELIGKLLKLGLQSQDRIKLPFEPMAHWTGDNYQRALDRVKEFQARAAEYGSPQQNPFYGSELRMFLPTERDSVSQSLADTLTHGTSLAELLRPLNQKLGIADGLPLATQLKVLEAMHKIAMAPDLAGIQLDAPVWSIGGELVATVIAAGRRLSGTQQRYGERLSENAWSCDHQRTRDILAAHGHSWFRMFNRDYRQARATVSEICRQKPPRTLEERLTVLDDLAQARKDTMLLKQNEQNWREAFGISWQGSASNWDHLERVGSWAIDFVKEYRQLPAFHQLLALTGDTQLRALLAKALPEIQTTLKAFVHAQATLFGRLEFSQRTQDHWAQSYSLAQQMERFTHCSEHLGELQKIVRYNAASETMKQDGLSFVVDAFENAPRPEKVPLSDSFEFTWASGLIRSAFTERSGLAQFNRTSHERTQAQFVEADRELLHGNAVALVSRHWEQLPRINSGGQIGLLRHEIEKGSRHLPLRKLLLEAGDAVQKIKPVFMMSPASIAKFLDPRSVQFDLVVFDEASQVRPVEALGALLRGTQVVVVGDNKQLQPSNFFDSVSRSEDEEVVSTTATTESILDLFVSQGARERMLQTHFRSRHPRLIDFSNERFYDGRLVVFPSPDNESPTLGVTYHHIPESSYDRGKSRANKIEAERVAERVLEHARTSPHLTLGVVAFSEAQMNAIYSALDRLRRNAPELDSFFDNHNQEPFFVKNLENVQGDERDVLLISVGYGRDELGNLSLNFGPVNKPNGENRLNVIASRAKMRREIFTNLAPEDIDTARSESPGVRELREFLRDARDGNMGTKAQQNSRKSSELTSVISERLRSQGYTVVENYGTAHCPIDIAVVDPNNPRRMIMGILTDGPHYQQAPSVRDRERITLETLDSLGWNLHRAWSVSWFTDAEAEMKLLEEKLARAISGERISIAQPHATRPEVQRDIDGRGPDTSVPIEPYQLADLTIKKGDRQLADRSRKELAQYVKNVVLAESPVHFDEIERRIRKAASIDRKSEQLEEALRDACESLRSDSEITSSGDFYMLSGQQDFSPRDRSAFASTSKKLALIAHEEIESAVFYTIKHSCGIREGQLVDACCSVFGFRSAPQDAAPFVTAALHSLMANHVVETRGEFLQISTGM